MRGETRYYDRTGPLVIAIDDDICQDYAPRREYPICIGKDLLFPCNLISGRRPALNPAIFNFTTSRINLSYYVYVYLYHVFAYNLRREANNLPRREYKENVLVEICDVS